MRIIRIACVGELVGSDISHTACANFKLTWSWKTVTNKGRFGALCSACAGKAYSDL